MKRFHIVFNVALVMGIGSHARAQCTAPYSIPKFQAAIAECKLQAPDSGTEATQAELIGGYCSDWFKVDDTDKMAFYQTGDSQRTELRYLGNWFINAGNRAAHANVNIVSQTCDQVTFMQIHDDANAGPGPNKPLVRIYRHFTRSPPNHIWAAIKTDSGGSNTEHVDLGPAPTGYFDCDITLIDEDLSVAIDGTTLVTRDVSFWTFPSYWKAGAYLQDAGEATIHFNELTWTDIYALTTNIVGQGSMGLNPVGGIYTDGTMVTVTATPDAGWQFDGWSDDLVGTQNPDTITVDADKTVTATFSVVPSGGTGTNVVVDDSFTDGNRANTGPLEADWYSSTSSSGNSIEAYTGQLGLVSGGSGRGIHGIFASQPLAIGDRLVATLTFTTPPTVGNNRTAALRFGFFDTTGHLPGLEADLTASSGNPNSNFNNLNGYMMDLDVTTGSENLTLRERDNPGSGRLLATTGDYADLGSGGNSYTFLANTTYTVEFSVRRQAAGEVQVTGSLYEGSTLLSTHTQSDSSATATEFGMLGVHANSSTFGSTTTHGPSEDNGITFSNIKIELVTPLVSPPILDITLSGGNVVLSWPTQDTTGFSLESKSDWSAPSWSPEGSPTVVGDQNQVTIPASGDGTYYRLNKP